MPRIEIVVSPWGSPILMLFDDRRYLGCIHRMLGMVEVLDRGTGMLVRTGGGGA